MLRFDEAQLVRNLNELPPRSRAVFAAACAERLRPAYLAFSARSGRGDAEAFERILDSLWLDLQGPSMSDEALSAYIELAMSLIPAEDDEPWFVEQVYAEDAGSALAYALECRRNGGSQEPAWAGRCVYDTLDHFVLNKENVDIADAEAEARVASHPLIQAEFARQQRDIEALRATSTKPEDTINAICKRAKRDAASVFGGPS